MMTRNNVSTGRCHIKIEMKIVILQTLLISRACLAFAMFAGHFSELSKFIILGKQLGDHSMRPKLIFQTWVFRCARDPLYMLTESFPNPVDFLF